MADELCKVCKRKVKDDHEAMQCDRCSKWVHIKCGKKITSDHYMMLKQLVEEVDIFWFCVQCKSKMKDAIEKETVLPAAKDEIIEALTSIKTDLHHFKQNSVNKEISYAEVAKLVSQNSSSITAVNIPKPTCKSGVIITPKDPALLSNQTINIVKEKVDKKILGGGVSLKPNGKSGCFLGAESNANSEDLKREIINQLGDQFNIKIPTAKRPQVILLGAKREFNPEQLAKEIVTSNQGFTEEECEEIHVVHIRSRKTSTGDRWDYIIESDLKMHQKLVNRYILVDFQHHFLKNYISITRCYNCQRYHHKATACTESVICAVCAGDHSSRNCSRQQEPKCINCAEANRNGAKFNTKHICGTKHCGFQQNLIKNLNANPSSLIQW